MERMTHWRAGTRRSGRVHRRNSGGRRLRGAAVAGAMVAAAMPALSADGAVGTGRSIEAFTGPDMIALTGYPPNTNVKVEVVRQGFVVGYTTRLTDSIGGVEINHVGGGAGDCFQSPATPDVQPTDTIRATVLKPGGFRDASVVRGVWVDDVQFGNTTITVSGHVALTGPAAVDPATDTLQLRINKDTDWAGTGRSDLRQDIGADVQDDGTWTHVVTATAPDVAEAADNAETFLEWSTADPTEVTVAEFGVPEATLGCPPPADGPSAPLLLKAHDSGPVGDHVTNQTTDLTFSGLAGTGVAGEPGPGETVTLQVDGADVDQVTADANAVYRFTGVDLAARATPHTVRVISAGKSASRLVTVDTTAPRVVLRWLGPSPLQLTGANRLVAVYRIGTRATLQARVEHVSPTFPVKVFGQRTTAVGAPAEFTWNGKNVAGRDVRPGRYRLVLQATDIAGNVSLRRDSFWVTR